IVAHEWTPRDVRFAMGANLAGTVMLAVAAYAPARPARVRRRNIWLGAAVAWLGLAALAALLAAGGPHVARSQQNPPGLRPARGAGRLGGVARHRWRARCRRPRAGPAGRPPPRALPALAGHRADPGRLREAQLRAVPAGRRRRRPGGRRAAAARLARAADGR